MVSQLGPLIVYALNVRSARNPSPSSLGEDITVDNVEDLYVTPALTQEISLAAIKT
jgi:hypothetical protein